MPDVTSALENSLAEFRMLNRRRLFGMPPLEVAELERWGELRDALEAEFHGPRTATHGRREHLRMPSHLKVVFRSGADLREAMLSNISEGGIFIATRRPLAEGTPLHLRILADPLPALEVDGRVTWVRELDAEAAGGEIGMGVRFEPVEGAAREHLDRVLDQVAKSLP